MSSSFTLPYGRCYETLPFLNLKLYTRKFGLENEEVSFHDNLN